MYILGQLLITTFIVMFFSWLLAGTILFIQQVIEDLKETK